jgi:glutaminyl-peptide cyclotransferase
MRRGLLVLLLAGCAEPLPPREVTGETLLSYVDGQLAFGPRPPGSEAHRLMAQWLDSMARARADDVALDDWTHVTGAGDTLRLRNVLARFNPAAEYRILYLAHWDTRPRADAKASTDTLAPVPGANDGASGVALLLGIADALKARPPTIGVDLLFADGEDYGSFHDTTETLLGSRRYARTSRGNQAPRFAVVWDIVADRDQRFVHEWYSTTGAPDVVAAVWRIAGRLGYADHFVDEAGTPVIDDHVPLQKAGIPAIDVIDLEYGPSNGFHHTPLDTRDKIDGESLARATHVATAVIRTAPH